MAHRRHVPAQVRSVELLERCGYEDSFGVSVSARRPPGAWARVIVDSAPRWLTWFIRVAQKHLLGLELARADLAHPLGWMVIREDEQAVVLAAEGPGGEARIVGTTPPGELAVTTHARFDTRRSRALWWLLAPVHRRIVCHLLDNAVERESLYWGRPPGTPSSSFT